MEENKEIMVNEELNTDNEYVEPETEYSESSSSGLGKVALGALIGVIAYKGIKFAKTKWDERKQKKAEKALITIITDEETMEPETEK